MPGVSPAAQADCAFCLDPAAIAGEISLGAGAVSDDAWRLGHYTGLGDRGLFAVGAVDLALPTDGGSRFRLQATDLGLDTRAIVLDGGEQGRYGLRLGYAQIPSRLYDRGATSARFGTDRETLDLRLRFRPALPLRYDLDYRYTARDGTALLAGSFLTQVAELARPLDDEWHNLDAGVTYVGEDGQARIGYAGSFYSSTTRALSWQDPDAPVTPGAGQGQLALEPDNEFHQLALAGSYRWSPQTSLAGNAAAGRLTQNEALLPFTLNPNLIGALPRTGAEAEVQTLHGDLRLTSRLTPALRIQATWVYDDRDNDTPVATWDYVVTDALPGLPRENLDYGYTRERLALDGNWRVSSRFRGAAGYEREVVSREQAEVGRTQEDEVWARLQLALGDAADLRLRYAYADRHAGDYRPVPGIPEQNPLLRKYNLADRQQGALAASLDLRPRETVDLTLTAELRDSDYSRSVLGLESARERLYGADGSVLLATGAVVGASVGTEKIRSRQAGSQGFAAPDWTARNTDDTRFSIVSLDLPELVERWRLRASYSRITTEGSIAIDQSGFVSPFPDLATRLRRAELSARYELRPRWSLLFRYAHEDYEVDDWSRDGLAPDALPRVLALGVTWQDYSAHVFSLAASYRLGPLP